MVLAFIVLATNALAGCSQTHATEEGLSIEGESALEGENSLIMNAIDFNGLLTNAIDFNGIDPALLSTALLAAIRDPGQYGENSRLLYKYLIGCALDSSQSASFSWTDSSSVVHNEVYWGSIGLAPHWRLTLITNYTRRTLSACLAARANFYGTPVMISLRGPQSAIQNTSTEEKAAYPMEEGAFWGDVFADPPQLYACHKSANIANSRSHLRECAAGHVVDGGPPTECAYISILGDCDTLCATLNSTGLYRPSCNDGIGGTTTNVITTFLPQ